MKVTGGFFWTQRVSAVIFDDAQGDSLASCVFMARPRWWQVGQWYRALRWWLSLPYEPQPARQAVHVTNQTGRPSAQANTK